MFEYFSQRNLILRELCKHNESVCLILRRKSTDRLEDKTQPKHTKTYDEARGKACSMSTKSHKKQESSFVSRSQDVLDSVALEDNPIGRPSVFVTL